MSNKNNTTAYKPIGVLRYNDDIRKELLMMHGDRYKMYTDTFQHAIGDTADISTRDVSSMTDGESLYDYTHSGNSDYSQEINRKNFRNASEKIVYSQTTPRNHQMMRWNGEYDDYRDYTDYLFGIDFSMSNYVMNLLSDNSIGYVFNIATPNVVRDLRVNDALGGRITTNSYGFREETRLGELSNRLYATSLYRGAVINSARHRDKVNTSTDDFGYGYITPILYQKYGNNLNNYDTMSGKFVVSSDTGRLSDGWLLGDDNTEIGKIVHDYTKLSASENGGKVYLDEQIKKANQEISIQKPYIVYTNKVILDDNNVNTATEIPGRFVINAASTGDTDTTTSYVYDGIKDDNPVVNTVKLKDNKTKQYFVYDEGVTSSQQNTEWGVYNSNETALGKNNLLVKTNQMFKDKKINTMIGRFHIKVGDSCTTDTAVDNEYGNAHGRALLKADPKGKQTNGVDNPYCRSWTYHHQYNSMDRLIRPFESQTIAEVQKKNSRYRSRFNKLPDGGKYLAENTVLGEAGRVNIAPSTSGNVDIKKCMFSLENLAWKDVSKVTRNISKEQIGPNGGRIMWFPPYDIDFQENVNVNWQSNSFIGRGEDVYTYTNTTRTGQLSFTLLIDHPAVINSLQSAGINDDEDVLRFFAGCDTIDPNETGNAEVVPGSKTSDPTLTAEEGPFVRVYCFFPNNYTGHGEYPDDEKRWYDFEDEEFGCSDGANWYKYILSGKNATGIEISGKGYEMSYKKNVATKWNGVSTQELDINTSQIVCNSYSGQYGKYNKCPEDYDGSDYEQLNLKDAEEAKKKRTYRYRVDFDFRERGIDVDKQNEKSHYWDNYIDTYSYGLNLDPVVIQQNKLDTHLFENHSLFSFYQLMCVFGVRKSFQDGLDEGIKNLSDIINNHTVYKVVAHGSATKQGTKNDLRAARRARTLGKTVMHFLKQIDKYKNEGIKYVKGDTSIVDVSNTKLVNTNDAKFGRNAYVDIYYDDPKVLSVEKSESANNQIIGAVESAKAKSKEKKQDKKVRKNNITYTTKDTSNLRYESEADYFKKIKKTDPVIFRKIVDKVQYFDPAFHSMSPEGFNARLTFLQQCTRQGHTVSATESNGLAMTAGNLAFGRMPVCVLRLGDFINTRIIIESLNITYNNGGMQWDLNPEGAGVQPMYAKVNMSIKILGGQSLVAPISRLQNAVSFNYYANAGVYDNRADRAHYKDYDTVYDYVYTATADTSANNNDDSYVVNDNAETLVTENNEKKSVALSTKSTSTDSNSNGTSSASSSGSSSTSSSASSYSSSSSKHSSSSKKKQQVYYGLNAYGKVIHLNSTKMAAFLLTKYSNNNYDLRKFTTRYNLTAFYENIRLYLKQGINKSKLISFNRKAGNTSVHISFEIKKVNIDYYHFSFPNKDGATIKDVTVTIPVRITPYNSSKHYWCNVKLNVGDMFINDCYNTYKNSVSSSIQELDNNFPKSGYVDVSQDSSNKWNYVYK
nr:MAG TPA: hypothetical protein [Caudoviricetes sp.]